MKAKRVAALLALAVLTAGCSYPISRNLRNEAKPSLSFPQVLEDPVEYTGNTVIWGGHIIKVVNYPDSTELIVLESPLDYTGEPESPQYSRGRFIIRGHKFLDPEVYKQGRGVTVAGQILGGETRPLGQTTYLYPVISVKQLYLWQKDTRYRYRYYDWWPGFNWWGPPPPYYPPPAWWW